mmetsp:Transcript_19630/g.41378  ORF Transcript_19630/g.41378 Transcript_19630/m.41378 type:complete len:199 (+) Transcript_19630:173-769(+)
MLRTTSSTMAKFARRGVNIPIIPSFQNTIDTFISAATPSSSSSSPRDSTPLRQMTVLSKDSASEFKKSNYTTRMAATRRPVSPHVSIYSFPICAMSSITTRVTGMCLSIGALGLGFVEIVGGNGAALELMSAIGSSGGVVAAGAKFSVAFPFLYHYLGGMRHLVWDNSPEMLTNVDVEKASYVLIGTSVLLSGVAVIV